METQTASTGESWRRWAMDFPLRRDIVGAWYLSCPPLLVSREQERETLSKQKEE
jgi:hypothetical protein